MKFCRSFVVFALATTACMAKRPTKRSTRRKEREERRKLVLGNLVDHNINNKVRGRASITFGEKNIIGVYFKPIYADDQLNTESVDVPATPREIPGDAPNTTEAPNTEATIPPTPVASPTPSTLNPVPKSKAKNMRNGGGGAKRNHGGGNGGGGIKGVGGGTGNGNGTRKRGVMRNGGNGNGNGNGVKRGTGGGTSTGGGSKEGSKEGSKSGSKTGKADGVPKTKNFASECRQLCEGVPFGQGVRTPVCDASSFTEFASIAEDNCCCSQGISFLKLRYDTIHYTPDPNLGGTFSIVKGSDTAGMATAPRDPSIDITAPSAAAKKPRGRNGRNKRKNVANAATETKEGPEEGPSGPKDEPLKGSTEIGPMESPTEISRIDGSEESIRVVDCDDNCLRNPMFATSCESARETEDFVSTGTEICIVQVDETGLPRFDWNFPPLVAVRLVSNVGIEFRASIDTSCGSPVVSPWGVMAMEGNVSPPAMHVKVDESQAELLMFAFVGGMSTGSFEEATSMGSFKEAGYQLGEGQCGCDCDDYPPTEPPTSDEEETNTLPPTIDWSCAPTETEVAAGSQRDAIPIANAGTEESPGTDDAETGPPTVVFNVASPTVPESPSPTRKPSAPPTDLPTIKPTSTPSNAPSAKPSAKPSPTPTAKPSPTPTASESDIPTCTDAPDGSMTKIEETAISTLENTCGMSGQKSIYDYVCSVNNFSNFCRMIERAGLVEVMDGIDGDIPLITLFAPTNKGCTTSGLSLDQINIMDTNLLKHIVMTHATAGKLSAESLQCDAQLPTLEGTFAVHSTKCFSNYAKAQIGFFNNEDDYPMILAPNDIDLCNGYVQPVNNIIRAINF